MLSQNPDLPVYISTAELVNLAKRKFGIDIPNDEMGDFDIKRVVRFIGWLIPQCNNRCRRPYCHTVDLLLMLIVTAVEFPRYFSRYNLFEEN